MKLKLLITILVLATLFSGVVLWRVDRFVYGDRMAWAEAQARTQIASLSQAINVEIQSARRMLSTVSNDSFRRESANWKAFQPYYALALMSSQAGNLGISRMVSKANSPAANWTANDLSQYIGFMGRELESGGTVLLRAFKDPQKKQHVAVIFAGGGNAYILIGSGENFQSMIESQKGSMNAVSLITSDGLMISHPTQDYVGTVMSDSTLLTEIRKTEAAQGLGAYKQGQQQIFGMYSQVPGTNSYVISTVLISDLLKGRLSLAWQFLFMAVGILLIGAAVYFWQEKKAEAQAQLLAAAGPAPPRVIPTAQRQPVAPSAPPPPAAPAARPSPVHDTSVVTSNETLAAPVAPRGPVPTSMPEVATETSAQAPELQQEKTEAYRQVAAALGQEMRSPLASILGFSQMVLAKTQDPEVVQAVESILREARSSRDVLEKLVTFTGEHSTEKTDAKIEGPIMQALKNIDGKLTEKGVRVEKDFQATSPWPLAAVEITKAFENLFMNAIEAMERMPEKTLKISTWEADDGLHVRIADSGEGIDPENLNKVFDPFFTTRSFAHHVGLGLPVVAGILKEHAGQMKIQSERGQGTQVELVFTARAEAVDLMSAPKAPPPPPPAAAKDLPMDLPKSVAAQEEVRVTMKETEAPKEKLTDINVDSLLELSIDDMPLQFLEGKGFDEEPPTAPLPEPVLQRPSKPAAPPPSAVVPSTVPPSAPPPSNPPPPRVAMDSKPVQEPEQNPEAEPETETPTFIIDKPLAAPMMTSKTELDSYKVAVRRPGKKS